MPARTFRYTGGNTIRAEINSGRERLSSHTRARMMKDTTGTAFTAAVRGASSSRTSRHRADRTASAAARTQPSKKPPKIWAIDPPTARQKAAVQASSPRRRAAETGDASSRWPLGHRAANSMLAPCHTSSQKATAQGLMEF